MKKIVKKFKDNKVVTEMCESDGVNLAPASETIERYWYEIIKDVFNYEMRREAELQEVHKLYEDKRVLEGLKLYKEGKVKEGAITDVDVRATVEGENGNYMVTLKKWKPLDKFDKPILIRHRYEIEDYIAGMFFDCSCQDHMIMHYKANSSCACKHICAVMWKLMEEDNMPKFFLKPEEKDYYKKSSNIDLVKEVKGLPMKQFSPYLNVVLLKEFRDISSSLSYSIHRTPNKGYEKIYPEGIKPAWITFTNPEDVEKLIKANIQGYAEMLANRKNTQEQIIKALQELLPEGIRNHSPEQPEEKIQEEGTAVNSPDSSAGSTKITIEKEDFKVFSDKEFDKHGVKPLPTQKTPKKGFWRRIKSFFSR